MPSPRSPKFHYKGLYHSVVIHVDIIITVGNFIEFIQTALTIISFGTVYKFTVLQIPPSVFSHGGVNTPLWPSRTEQVASALAPVVPGYCPVSTTQCPLPAIGRVGVFTTRPV